LAADTGVGLAFYRVRDEGAAKTTIDRLHDQPEQCAGEGLPPLDRWLSYREAYKLLNDGEDIPEGKHPTWKWDAAGGHFVRTDQGDEGPPWVNWGPGLRR
jgi:hypothetical protein